MKPAGLPSSEAARLRALHETGLLDTPPEQAFDDLARLAALVCGTPIGLVTLVDAARQWFKARVGLDAPETSRDIAFCAHAILHPNAFVVRDAQADDRFADNPLVTGDPHVRFYAGIPLAVTPGGEALGTLCVIDRIPRDLSAEQRSALEAIGRQVLAQIELRRHAMELQRLQALKDDLCALIMHDVRNPLSGVMGFVELIQSGLTDPGHARLRGFADQAMRAAQNMRQLVDGILEIRAHEEGSVRLRLQQVAIGELAREAAANVRGAALARKLTLRVEVGSELLVLADVSLVRRAVENLLTNAIKFSPAGETVLLSTKAVGGGCEFAVADRGPGISGAMKTVLFQKFATEEQKGPQARGFGLGLYLVKLVAEAHRGTVSALDHPGGGTTMRLFLPASPPPQSGLAT